MPMDAKSLGERIQGYFSVCDETTEELWGRNGRSGTRRLPYTLAGLAEHVGMAKAALLSLAKGRGPKAEAVAAALRRIERYTVERALLGELSGSVAAMLLHDLGVPASGADDEDAGRIVIIMEDKEGWSV
jgi:hypothetical protein